MSSLKEYFLLDQNIVFLNHGSYGATPKPVFEAYQNWQLRLERQPVLFLGREIRGLLQESRQALGEYLNASAEDLVYIPNATHGVNIIARSVELGPGDEILTTDHEYGACDYTWDFVCGKMGAKYIHQSIPLPVNTEEEIVEQFWQGVTSETKATYLSHITSSTALRLPVEILCQRARQAGILSIVDAAHSPGQIPVDLQTLGADMVFGNCHKWMDECCETCLSRFPHPLEEQSHQPRCHRKVGRPNHVGIHTDLIANTCPGFVHWQGNRRDDQRGDNEQHPVQDKQPFDPAFEFST